MNITDNPSIDEFTTIQPDLYGGEILSNICVSIDLERIHKSIDVFLYIQCIKAWAQVNCDNLWKIEIEKKSKNKYSCMTYKKMNIYFEDFSEAVQFKLSHEYDLSIGGTCNMLLSYMLL